MSRRPYSCGDDVELFFRKLPRQYGGALSIERPMYFAGVRRQRGAGIGGIFGTLARRLLPFAKKYILPYALEAVKNIATDLSEGKNFKESLKENAVSALKSAGNQIINQSGSGMRRGKNKSRAPAKSTKRSTSGKQGNSKKKASATKKSKAPKKSTATKKGRQTKAKRCKRETSPFRSIFH